VVKKTSERTHGDQHALWIDPTDPNYLINGNDGGVVVTEDGGKMWNNFFDVIPTTQFLQYFLRHEEALQCHWFCFRTKEALWPL
jgi:photosystem II stability/assembly factor-like uncharacterized protein